MIIMMVIHCLLKRSERKKFFKENCGRADTGMYVCRTNGHTDGRVEEQKIWVDEDSEKILKMDEKLEV